MFTYFKGKATMIIWGVVIATFLSLSSALWFQTNRLEKTSLKLTNAEQTIANKEASLLQLRSDIRKQEEAIKDLNTLQDAYDNQIKDLKANLKALGREIDSAIVIVDPIEKEKAVEIIEQKLDDEILNSYNCLMKASGDETKECK